jgi:beta-galactosidase
MTIAEARTAHRLPLRVEGLAFGGDYNPEQWPEDVWVEDVRLMNEAGVNLVTVGVFSWARVQPAPGTFDFGWLDHVLDLLWDNGIAVDLATATATPPAWLVRSHPEMLPMGPDGIRLDFGSRQSYCPSSPVFRDHLAALTRTMAERYAGHPALVLWHVSNEYGDHVARCWCPESSRHFRRWLRARYQSLDVLNDAWGTAHWGQTYADWDHVEVPRRQPGPQNPTQVLDFKRFSSDAIVELFTLERDIVREVSPGVPVTTNFMSMFPDLDYWDLAAEEDLVSNDAYPDPADPDAHVTAALNYDLMRSLGHGRPWLLLEQAPAAVSWRDVNVPKRPGLMRLWSLHAVARGSDGVMFFQWRQSRYGTEKVHSAMLPRRGTQGRTWRETAALGSELGRLAEVAGSRVRARVAVLLDWNSWWALDVDESVPSTRMRWRTLVTAFYAALYRAGVVPDFVRPGGDLAGYDLVVAPNAYLLTRTHAAWLTEYVAARGVAVVGPYSGVVDQHDHLHHGGSPGPLTEVLGVEVDEWWPLPDGQTRSLVFTDGTAGHAHVWTEWIEATTAEPEATFTDQILDGLPAITRNRHGEGVAWYVAALPDDDTLDRVLAAALHAAGIERPIAQPAGVEAVVRHGADADYTFLLNHTTDPVYPSLPSPGTDLLTGEHHQDAVALPPLGVAVLRSQPSTTKVQ